MLATETILRKETQHTAFDHLVLSSPHSGISSADRLKCTLCKHCIDGGKSKSAEHRCKRLLKRSFNETVWS